MTKLWQRRPLAGVTRSVLAVLVLCIARAAHAGNGVVKVVDGSDPAEFGPGSSFVGQPGCATTDGGSETEAVGAGESTGPAAPADTDDGASGCSCGPESAANPLALLCLALGRARRRSDQRR